MEPSEKVAIGEALWPEEYRAGKDRQKLSLGQGIKGRKNFPTLKVGKTQDKVAARVGMSGQTYGRAKDVVEASECESFHSFYAVPFAPSPTCCQPVYQGKVKVW